MSWLFLVLACLSITYSINGYCNDISDCVSCADTKSWSGHNCRWCPLDSECHAFGAIFTNECSRTENVVDSDDCDKIVLAEYDKNLAYKMIFLCALAYSDNVTKYIPRASEVDTFHLVKQVTKPCSGNAHCSGFVAVSHSEEVIAIAFRGTEHFEQTKTQTLRILVEPKRSFTQADGKVQGYFLDAFELVWNDLKKYVYKEIDRYPSYKVWMTGHSLGGALASLASTLIRFENKKTKDSLVLYTFGQPRVGNYKYALTHDELVPLSFRVTHYRDIVVHLPTCHKIAPATSCVAAGGGPYHHGKEIYYGSEIMTKDSLDYKVCEGLPHNEDFACSNNPLVWSQCFSTIYSQCIADHKQYFGISIGTWCENSFEKDQTLKTDKKKAFSDASFLHTSLFQSYYYVFYFVFYYVCV